MDGSPELVLAGVNQNTDYPTVVAIPLVLQGPQKPIGKLHLTEAHIQVTQALLHLMIRQGVWSSQPLTPTVEACGYGRSMEVQAH